SYPEGTTPIHVEVFEGHFYQGEIQGFRQFGKKMRPALQQLIINEVAEKGAVGAAGLAYKASKDIFIFLILQHVKLFYHAK
ncbi:MAG: hypothetical protein NTY36_03195, partial [Deltaproteobacteria bacterium]|nr:hypothetical protein [Deltaproteobacteria bacterium]